MKKKIIGIGVAIVLVVLLLFLTGCGNTNEDTILHSASSENKIKDSSNQKYDISGMCEYLNGYAWLEVYSLNENNERNYNSHEYVLVDQSGKILYRDDTSKHTNVFSNYFILDNKLYNIQNGEVDLGDYNNYNKYIGTDNDKRDILCLSNTEENFEGTNTDIVYLDLTNMKEIDGVEKFYNYKYANTLGENYYREYHDDVTVPFKKIEKNELEYYNDPDTGYSDKYKCVTNNGYFTIIDDTGNQRFEAIKGTPVQLDYQNKSVLMVDENDKMYVVDVNGTKTELPNVKYSNDVYDYQFDDNMIGIRTASYQFKIMKGNGELITIHD